MVRNRIRHFLFALKARYLAFSLILLLIWPYLGLLPFFQQIISKSAFALSADGEVFVSASKPSNQNTDGKSVQFLAPSQELYYVYNVQDEHLFGSFPMASTNSFAIKSDKLAVAFETQDAAILIWQLNPQHLQYSVQLDPTVVGYRGEVQGVTYSTDGSLLAATDIKGNALIWQAHDGTMVQRLSNAYGASDIAFSPDGRYLIATLDYAEHMIRVWRVADGSVVSDTLVDHQPRALAISQDGAHVAVGLVSSEGGQVAHYAFQEGQLTLVEQWWPSQWPLAVAFSPDGRYIAAGGFAGGYSTGWVSFFPTWPSSQRMSVYQVGGLPWPVQELQMLNSVSDDIAFTRDGTMIVSQGDYDLVVARFWPFPIPLLTTAWMLWVCLLLGWLWVQMFGSPRQRV